MTYQQSNYLRKYKVLIKYIAYLYKTKKIYSLTRSHINAIIKRYQNIIKKIPIGLALLSLGPASSLNAQCNDPTLVPQLFFLDMSGTNSLGRNASPLFQDVDNDGLKDLVVPAWPGIEVYRRDVIGTYALMYDNQENPFGDISITITGAYFFEDLIVDGTDRDELMIYENNGLVIYKYDEQSNRYIEQTNSDELNPFQFIFGNTRVDPFFYDNNEDGVRDAVVLKDGLLRFFTLNAQGFYEENMNSNIPVVSSYKKPRLLDLDQDSFYETLVMSTFSGQLVYWQHNGSTFAEANSNPFVGLFSEELYDFTFQDLDNDGDEDLVVGTQSGRINTYTNNNGVYSLNNISKDPLYDVCIASDGQMLFYDWDCDGDEDIFSVNLSGISYNENTGQGYNPSLFGQNDFFSNLNVGLEHLALLESDTHSQPIAIVGRQDGKMDMLSFNPTNQKYELIPDHSLRFEDVGLKATPTLFDFDSDGDQDLFVGSDAGPIRYYMNLGDNNFERLIGGNPFEGLIFARNSSLVLLFADGDIGKDAFVSNGGGIDYLNYDFSSNRFIRNDSANPFLNLDASPNLAVSNIYANGKNEVILSQGGCRLITFSNITNSSCYPLDDCSTNRWVGNEEDEWNDSVDNWFLRRIPQACDAVSVQNDYHLVIPAQASEESTGLIISEGGILEVLGQLTVDLPE